MPRGQSPYQGRYTVPIHDYSPITEAGAAWGEAFKGFGRDIGAGIKERKELKADLEGIKGGLKLLERSPLGERYRPEIEQLKVDLDSPEKSLRERVQLGKSGIGLAIQMFGLEARMPKPTGADEYTKWAAAQSDDQPAPPPPDLTALGGEAPDVPSPMPDQPAPSPQDLAALGGASGVVAPPTTAPAPPPPTSSMTQIFKAGPTTPAPAPAAPAPAPTAPTTAAATAPVPGLEPPTPLTQEQQRLLEWGRGAGLKDVDSTIRPQLNAARAKEKELREWPIQQLEFEAQQIALKEQRFKVGQTLQPGMTKDALKQEVSSLRETFPDLDLHFNVSEKKGEEGKAGYKLTFNATPRGPTFTRVTAEVDGEIVKLPLWANGTDYFVVDPNATDPKDILKNIGKNPTTGLSAHSADLGRSIKELREETVGVDEAGKQFTVGEFEDLAQILRANSDLLNRYTNDDGNIVWELDVEGWDDDIVWAGKAHERANAKLMKLSRNLKSLEEISAQYEELPPTRVPQPMPTPAGPPTLQRAREVINRGRLQHPPE